MYKPTLVKIESIEIQTKDEVLIRVNHSIEAQPGQFLQISVMGVGEAPISICSHQEEYFEISVRSVGNVTSALCNLKKGDKIGIRGPFGRGYPVQLFKGDSIIMVGGGCGVAPMRSAIEYIEKNKDNYKTPYLFFGFNTEDEILFKEDFEKWSKNFEVNIAISKPTKNWKGHKGFVTQMLEKVEFDNKNKVVFVCGPPAMINAVITILKKGGFNTDQVFVSFERHMKCGIGVCGHCMIHGKYTCKDGPVFRYDEVREFNE